jgi:hypothetical protein
VSLFYAIDTIVKIDSPVLFLNHKGAKWHKGKALKKPWCIVVTFCGE